MRSADLLPVKESLVIVAMALGTGKQGGVHGTELDPAVLAVTRDTNDPSIHVGLNHCRHESISRMARRALRFHAGSESMTRSARSSVRMIRHRRRQNHVCSGMGVRNSRRTLFPCTTNRPA